MVSSSPPVASSILPFLDARGRLFATAIVKATFTLTADGLAAFAPPLPLWEDAATEGAGEACLDTASDFAPRKALTDVIVTGCARPAFPQATRAAVGFAIARGPEVLIRKRLVARGDRARPLDGLPVSWEHTWGGPSCDENPVGVGLAPGDVRSAAWVDPDAPRRPACLSAIAPWWSPRSVHLPAADAEALRRAPLVLSRDLDLRYFQAAPRDQQLPYLRGGEQILLVSLRPSHPLFISRLPALTAYARLLGAATRRLHVALVGDTLWIDAERGIASVTYRGTVLIAPEASGKDRLREADSWSIEAGLAPCIDVEETLGSPRGWADRAQSAPLSAGIRKTSPAVDPVTIDNASGFAAASFSWSFAKGKARRVLVVKASFDLDPRGGEPSLAATQAPPGGDELSEEGSDAELLRASDYAAFKAKTDVILRGTAHAPEGATATVVALSLGSLHVRAVVTGPRSYDGSGIPRPPGPFASLPLLWEHAFGGPGYAANPAGTGFVLGTPPPRIERPGSLVRARGDRPMPAGFGPVAPAWPARASLLGLYDATWQRERWPYFPSNFDPGFYQAAPPSQQIDEPRGGEPFRVESVRPGGGDVSGVLPSLRPRAFVVRASGDPFEVRLALDTIVIDTDAATLSLVFRGSFEPEGAKGDPLSILVLRESAAAPVTVSDVATRIVGRSEPRLLRSEATEERHQSAEDEVSKKAPLKLFEAIDHDTSRAAKTRFAERAIDALPPSPAPPKPPSRAEIEAMVREGKSLAKCDLTGADLVGIDLSGQDLTGALLSRARLHDARFDGARLSGVDLGYVVAPRSSWIGAELSRSEWTGAVLAEARFDRSTLDRASLVRANLEKACLDGASALGASFAGAALRSASLEGAKLKKADFSGANLDFARLRGASLKDAKLVLTRGAEACFDEANLEDARFEQCGLPRASFVRSEATGTTFECCDLEGASFEGAVIEGAIATGSRLTLANLTRARARRASFREADLSRARLDGADAMRASFEGALLSQASLRNANLFEADLREAVTTGADFGGALREKPGK